MGQFSELISARRAKAAAEDDIRAAFDACEIERGISTPSRKVPAVQLWQLLSEWQGDGTTRQFSVKARLIARLVADSAKCSDLAIRQTAREIQEACAEWHGEQEHAAILDRDDREAREDHAAGVIAARTTSWTAPDAKFMGLDTLAFVGTRAAA